MNDFGTVLFTPATQSADIGQHRHPIAEWTLHCIFASIGQVVSVPDLLTTFARAMRHSWCSKRQKVQSVRETSMATQLQWWWLVGCNMKHTAKTFWHAGKQTRSAWPLTDWKVLHNQIKHSNLAHHVQFETGLAGYQNKRCPGIQTR